MKRIIFALLFLFLPLNAVTTEQQAKHYLYKGYLELVNEEYVKAIQYFSLAALKGSPSGLYWYAYCAEFGLGCTKNLPRALMYYTMAKRLGNPKAIDRMKNEADVIY